MYYQGYIQLLYWISYLTSEIPKQCKLATWHDVRSSLIGRTDTALHFTAESVNSSHIPVGQGVNPEVQWPLYKHTQSYEHKQQVRKIQAARPCLSNQSESSLHCAVWLICIACCPSYRLMTSDHALVWESNRWPVQLGLCILLGKGK